MNANARKWEPTVGSTQDGMVWFDGKKITPNDARKLAKALDYIALEAFDCKPRSFPITILVAKEPVKESKRE